MGDDVGDDGAGEGREDSDSIDLELEWKELRVREWFRGGDADDARGPLWLFPVLLLYIGFFFGPFVTVAAAVFTMKGRMTVRHAALLTGVAGTAWCLLQGLSIAYGATWPEYQLQGVRSAANFLVGIVAYVTVRKRALPLYRPTRVTAFVSLAVILLAVVAFSLLPTKLLIAMGR